MRKLLVNTFLTLDGVMQAPGGPEEDDSGGFALGGWSVNYWDDRWASHGRGDGPPSTCSSADGPTRSWPGSGRTRTEAEGAKPLNDATKYVASRDRPALTWDGSVLIEGDVAEGIAELKHQDGPELQVHGSGNLIQTLMRNGLVDRYRLWILGRGRQGEAALRRRHGPAGAETPGQPRLDHGRPWEEVRAGGGDRHAGSFALE